MPHQTVILCFSTLLTSQAFHYKRRTTQAPLMYNISFWYITYELRMRGVRYHICKGLISLYVRYVCKKGVTIK